MRKVALLNQKGGVGKTTSTANIGRGLTNLGKKVMLIDLDPQANLTYSLGIAAHNLDHSIYDVLKGETDIDSVILSREGISVAPSSLELSGAEYELASVPGREFLLKESLENHNTFEYVLIDCPPSLGLLTLNALTTSDEIWIPLQTEFLPMQGMAKLMQTVDIIKKRLNKSLEITGIICTRYDHRKKLNREVIEKIKEHFGKKVFDTLIHENISLAEAPGFGQTIFAYKPESRGAQDYQELCNEVLERQ
jgi:chromosome partitioning protein